MGPPRTEKQPHPQSPSPADSSAKSVETSLWKMVCKKNAKAPHPFTNFYFLDCDTLWHCHRTCSGLQSRPQACNNDGRVVVIANLRANIWNRTGKRKQHIATAVSQRLINTTSSTWKGGGGSFKFRKHKGEVGGLWRVDGGANPLSLSLSSNYLPFIYPSLLCISFSLFTMFLYLSVCLSVCLSIFIYLLF